MPNAKHSSDSIEFFTPLPIVEAARSLLGGFDLDPATTKTANDDRIQAKRYFTKEHDGLARKWKGSVFLNPPGGSLDSNYKPKKFGRYSSAKVWWEKLTDEWIEGRVSEAIFVAFSLEQLQTTQSCRRPMTSFPFCIPDKRIAFDVYRRGKFIGTSAPTHANAIIFLSGRKSVREFGSHFAQFGAICEPVSIG